MILAYVPLLVARILAAEPIEVIVVELDPADSGGNLRFCNRPHLTLADGAEALRTEASCSGECVRRHVAATNPVAGPFVCAQQAVADASIIVYDGVHRMAAWRIHATSGRPYSISVNLIKTKEPPR